jgi:hypothetical protein
MAAAGTAWIHSAIRAPRERRLLASPRVVSCWPSKRATPRNRPLRQPALDRFRLAARPHKQRPHQLVPPPPNGRLALVVSSSLALGSRASCGIAACAQQHSDSLLSIGVPKPLAREGRTRAEECGLGGD